MSVDIGNRPSLALEITPPHRHGNVIVMVMFEHATLYNNLYERRRRLEVDSALSHHFTESLRAYFELPGVITLARDVLWATCLIVDNAFQTWIRSPLASLRRRRWAPSLFPPLGLVRRSIN